MKKIILLLCIVCWLLAACQAPHEVIEIPLESVPETTEAIPETTEAVPETTAVPLVITPLPNTVDVEQLDDCTVAISLNEGDAYVDDTGIMRMKVTVYAYDVYDLVDISMLKVGDTIVIGGEEVPVTDLAHDGNGDLIINGGIEMGGHQLRTDENGVFYEIGYSDMKSWYPVGEATLRVSADFLYTDSSDLDRGEVVYYPGDFLYGDAGIDYFFVPQNTTIVIEEGIIIQMHRIYVP